MREDIKDLALQYSCEYCQANPGVWCRTLKGASATALHSARTWPLYSAFGMGYEEGHSDRVRELVTWSKPVTINTASNTASTARWESG